MAFRIQSLIVAMVLLTGASLGLSAQAQPTGILDSLARQEVAAPVSIGGQTTTASGWMMALSQLNGNPTLQIRHILRARQFLPAAEQKLVVKQLKAQVDQQPDNNRLWMVLGLAQVALDNNKTGLFYLRKANDALHTNATELAYALGQAQAELVIEQASPEEITVRKLDVAYLLHEAVKQDVAQHSPGFWPLFAETVSQLKAVPGYSTLLTRDYSELYVPLGNRMVQYVAPYTVSQYLASQGLSATSSLLPAKVSTSKPVKKRGGWFSRRRGDVVTPEATATTPTPVPADSLQNEASVPVPMASTAMLATPVANSGAPAVNQIVETRYVKLVPADPTQWVTVQLVTRQPGQPATAYPLDALILNKNRQLIGQIVVPDRTSIVEDLERDGQFELVVRQFATVPREPVKVYRVTAQGLVPDTRIDSLFK